VARIKPTGYAIRLILVMQLDCEIKIIGYRFMGGIVEKLRLAVSCLRFFHFCVNVPDTVVSSVRRKNVRCRSCLGFKSGLQLRTRKSGAPNALQGLFQPSVVNYLI
jgi:hypothetical protein